MRGATDSTPSICFSSSTYFVLKLAEDEVKLREPGRVKIISAVTFDERFCRSSDMPCARPVKIITSATPKATPRMLIADLSGRCRRLETTKLSKGALSKRGILIHGR